MRFPCVHAVATTPAQRLGVLLCSITQSCQPSPIWQSGRPAHRPFRGLLGVHSRYGLHTRAVTVFRDTLAEGFNHFVTSIVAPVASGWSSRRVGLAPTGKAPPFHGAPLGRVEMWRGGSRFGLSVAAPFVWRCPTNLAVAPFPHPAHRTGHADLPHPALGQDVTPSPTAVVPSPRQTYETEVPVEVREWIAPAPASPDLVLGAQPPA